MCLCWLPGWAFRVTFVIYWDQGEEDEKKNTIYLLELKIIEAKKKPKGL